MQIMENLNITTKIQRKRDVVGVDIKVTQLYILLRAKKKKICQPKL